MRRASGASSPILTITGPTAVGKTGLSLRLAQRLDAEIVSVDSRQIYIELNIGTAKPSAEELKRVSHHFISERSVNDPISSGQFAQMAEERIAAIYARGKHPLVVGGSTLYLHALQHGMADIPPIDSEVRRKLIARLKREGSDALFAELTRFDPAAARTMDSTKTQRIVRALEVFHGTGRPLSSYHRQAIPPSFRYQTFVIHRERGELYRRIEARVDAMLEAGLVEEVRRLMQGDYDLEVPVFRTIGYQESLRYLRGKIGYQEMVRLLKRNTRRYAKRQLTWFRRFEEYVWVEADRAFEEILAST